MITKKLKQQKALKIDLTSINSSEINQNTSNFSCKYSSLTSTRNIDIKQIGINPTFRNFKTEASENYIPGIKTPKEHKILTFNNKIIKEVKPELDDYIRDLSNTWILNMEVMTNYIKQMKNLNYENEVNYTFSNFQTESKIDEEALKNEKINKENEQNENEQNILVTINKILDFYHKKTDLIKKTKEMKGKILITKLIEEENRRIFNETTFTNNDNIDLLEENMIKKESIINQNEKKFDEVDIYIEKESKENANFLKYAKIFKIVYFLRENQVLSYKKHISSKEIKKYQWLNKDLTRKNNQIKENNIRVINEEENEDEDEVIYKNQSQNQYDTQKEIVNNNVSPLNNDQIRKLSAISRKSLKPKGIIQILNTKIDYFTSLIQYKSLLLSTITQKTSLLIESNQELNELIKKSRFLLKKGSFNLKEIDFKNYNLIESLTDDQKIKSSIEKDNLNLKNRQKSSLYSKSQKAINEIKQKIFEYERNNFHIMKESPYIEYKNSEGYDSNSIYLSNSIYHKRMNSNFYDESFILNSTKRNDYLNENKWDVSVINTFQNI